MKRYVVAIDPGKTTGFVLVDTEEQTVMYSGELDFNNTGINLQTILSAHTPEELDVVVEKFTVTVQTAKNSQALFSSEVIGMVKWISKVCKYPEPELQTPSAAKNQADNAMLKRLGLWHKGGDGHANDAMRHVVHYMVRKGWKSAKMLGDVDGESLPEPRQ